MNYRLNRKSLERLKALLRAGAFVDKAWTWSVADSNALLGDPPNWTEYGQWFLGYEVGKPESLAQNGATDQTADKTWYAYPFGKGDVANLQALREIAAAADKGGEGDIASAARDCLAIAAVKVADAVTGGGLPASKDSGHRTLNTGHCDIDIRFGSAATVKAGAGKKLPTFDANAYTGVPMQLEGFSNLVLIDYAGMDFTTHSRPALRDHDPKRPIGHTTHIAVQGQVLKATGEISVVSPDAQEVVDSGKNGFPWQISVGAKVLEQETVPEGATATANGKDWSGPLTIARRTSLREISFLSLGADDNTSARIAAQSAKGKPQMKAKLKSKFAAWAKARNLTMADMEDDDSMKAYKAAYRAAMKCDADDPDDADADDDDDKKKKDADSAAAALQIRAAAAGTQIQTDAVLEMRAALVAERTRVTVLTAKLDEYRTKIPADKFAVIEAKALSGEWSADRMELQCVRDMRPVPAAPSINTGKGGDLSGSIIAAAAAMSNGIGQQVACEGLDERAGNIATSRKLRGMTLHGIIAAVAPMLGLHAHAGGITRDFLDEFMLLDKAKHRADLRAHNASGLDLMASSGGGFATMSLTGILENILNKAMLEQYGLQVSVVDDIAYQRDTSDFKPFKVYRLTAAGDLEPVGPGGEIKVMSLQDESYSNQVLTKAALIPVKREDMINDEMGAITQTPQIAGRKGALNREKAVFATFLSGLTTVAPGASVGKTANAFNFFSTGASNYMSGGSSALSITSMTTAAQKFVQQTDADGDPIMIAPDRVLTCPEIFDTAKAIYGGASLVVGALGSTSSKELDANLNVHAGNYRPIRSPYLGGSSPVTGASATQWALLGNPAGGMATVQVGYLRGQRTPIIRQVETDATMLGLSFQIIYDFGVALLDYRCGVYSAGA